MTGHFELLAILSSAVLIVWLFRRLHLPAILAYLVAGMLVGDHGLSLVQDQVDYDHFAELGIVFLLFTLGLEFSLPKLIAMRHLVLAVGSLQVGISLVFFMGIALFFGQTFASSLVIGGIIALSSTAIVIRQLSETGAMKRKSGQLSVAILLFQDVAVVPLLIIIPMLAQESDTSMAVELLIALVKGIFVVTLLMFAGKWLLPRLFNLVAQVRTDELFVLTTLLVTLVASSLTQWFGLSMALGAFLAGMMLGESKYKYQLEADIRPYRDILLGLFFVTVGMKLDIVIVYTSPFIILSVMVSFMVVKILIIAFLAQRAGEASKDAWAAGFMLAQMGEFGFVLIALANQVKLLPVETASILLGAGVLSMAITPYMINNARRWSLLLSNEKPIETDHLTELPEQTELSDHVIICGFGRIGQTVSRFLKQESIKFVAIDIDPLRTSKAREAGENVLFGSSRQTELLQAAHLSQAKLVVIAFGEDKQSLEVIQKVRSMSPDVPILVRTRNDDQLQALQEAGANQVVPESLEGSLMLVSQVLSLTGVPFSRIIRRVQKERKDHYSHLHGFFQGEHTDMSPEAMDRIEFANAIILTENSFAIGHSIASLNLSTKRVTVVALRRNDIETEQPDGATILQAQDTLIVRGKPRRVERVERFLQEGG
ncbi:MULTISPECIES: monovalent cation:proton antiporter family protein [unclassified Colwellia]|uniref:monovalent cation:proton antiporter family protein n=1 Tax=unclassified Colwellia TaxID=196834 RepID=UPI0015F74373|nr:MULTISPECIES: monovalent cation:proton antiporter family protein [unclassified Colwellia]MBA6233117.1 cation:proton antiporter [Colwellia sp. MB02u-7]MBA6236795.1 cation:proton antiporter [Colwellia sp. MB02u-11]MBA6299204.1 cation:proton antiporter [Colwellia sp. MB3u-22]MBA6310419.1 cation:proton antiporter [Colwellia sp. MB3u-64]